MCGRTKLVSTPDILSDLFALTELPDLPPRFNVAPTQPIAVIRRAGVLELLRFGLLPPFAKSPAEASRFINARSETVARLPVYRDAFRTRRCLVVVDGFYEWRTTTDGKAPHLIRLRSGQPFAIGGVWGTWTSSDGEVIDSVSLLTAPAAGIVTELHDRMPLILAPDRYSAWMDPTLEAPEALLTPGRVDELVTEPVSKAVNNPRNDTPACIAPPDPPRQASLF